MEHNEMTSPDYEYIVYLRPRGNLAKILQQYSEKSKAIKSNDAHKYLPHCTLTGFFKIPQSIKLELLMSLLHESIAGIKNRLGDIVTVTHIFDNGHFIGLSFNDDQMLQELQPCIQDFAKKMTKYNANVRVKPEPGSHYHISLAYGEVFSQTVKQQLLDLVGTLNVTSAFNQVEWVVEIYCRRSKDQTAEEWMSGSIEDELKRKK